MKRILTEAEAQQILESCNKDKNKKQSAVSRSSASVRSDQEKEWERKRGREREEEKEIERGRDTAVSKRSRHFRERCGGGAKCEHVRASGLRVGVQARERWSKVLDGCV